MPRAESLFGSRTLQNCMASSFVVTIRRVSKDRIYIVDLKRDTRRQLSLKLLLRSWRPTYRPSRCRQRLASLRIVIPFDLFPNGAAVTCHPSGDATGFLGTMLTLDLSGGARR